MTDAEDYRRRADEAERWSRECREKIRYKPQSRAAYEMQHDWALADMFFNDALARAATRDPANMARQMREFEGQVATGRVTSTAIEQDRFSEHLMMLVARYTEKGA